MDVVVDKVFRYTNEVNTIIRRKYDGLIVGYADYISDPSLYHVEALDLTPNSVKYIKINFNDFKTEADDKHYIAINIFPTDNDYIAFRDKELAKFYTSMSELYKKGVNKVYKYLLPNLNTRLYREEVDRRKELKVICEEYLDNGNFEDLINSYATNYDMTKEDFCNTHITQTNILLGDISELVSIIGLMTTYYTNYLNDSKVYDSKDYLKYISDNIDNTSVLLTNLFDNVTINGIIREYPLIEDMPTAFA